MVRIVEMGKFLAGDFANVSICCIVDVNKLWNGKLDREKF
jgi:hypothetical protein